MPPSTEDRLRDILEAIQAIEHMLGGADLEQFTSDRMRRMAVERYLEIVCEAAHRLTDEVKREAPQIDWRGMVDFGNRLRHAYHATDVGIVWKTIQNHLPPLKSFVQRRIGTSDQ